MPDSNEIKRWAEEADRILKSEVFAAAVQEVDRDLVRQWRNSATVDERENAFHALCALDNVVQQLHRTLNAGLIENARKF